jgi:hypothetical protein
MRLMPRLLVSPSSTTSPRLLPLQMVRCSFYLFPFFVRVLTSYIVLFLLVPDQVQPPLFNQQVGPHLKPTATIVVASGYNVFFKLLNFKPEQDVVMVAPRYAFTVLLQPIYLG